MNAQQVFDKVADHLWTQGVPSIDALSGYCMYRGEEGRSCAVGCLIPDDVYSQSMEDLRVAALVGAFGTRLPPFIKEHVELLSRLQSVHDSAVSMVTSGMKPLPVAEPFTDTYLNERLAAAAHHYGLTYTNRFRKETN